MLNGGCGGAAPGASRIKVASGDDNGLNQVLTTVQNPQSNLGEHGSGVTRFGASTVGPAHTSLPSTRSRQLTLCETGSSFATVISVGRPSLRCTIAFGFARCTVNGLCLTGILPMRSTPSSRSMSKSPASAAETTIEMRCDSLGGMVRSNEAASAGCPLMASVAP